MKKFLTQNQMFNCPTCKANYAVGKSPTKMLNQITPGHITSWLGKAFMWFIFVVIIALLILFVSSFDDDNSLVQVWRIILIVLFGIVLSLAVLYIIFVIRSTIRKLKRTDIEVYCNQTEVGYHPKNAKDILKEYYDNAVEFSLLEDYQMDEKNDDKYENTKRGSHTTNMSLQHSKEDQPKKNRHDRNMDKILSMQDYDEESDMKKRPQKDNSEAGYTGSKTKPQANLNRLASYRSEKKELKKFQPEPALEEMSSIKADMKFQAHNDSSHSVSNIMHVMNPYNAKHRVGQNNEGRNEDQKGDFVQLDIRKKPSDKEDVQAAGKTGDNEQNMSSRNNKSIKVVDDIEFNPPVQNHNQKDDSLSLSFTAQNAVAF